MSFFQNKLAVMKMNEQNNKLVLLGGKPTVTSENKKLFHWPIITKEHEEAVLEVLRSGYFVEAVFTHH